MKKFSLISLVILSFLLSVFSLPAQGQISASQGCRLVEDISIEINVADVPPTNVGADNPPAGVGPEDFGELVAASRVLSIRENSNVASTPGAMAATPPQVTDQASPATPVAADEDQMAAIAEEWGTICLVNTINNIINWIFFILLTVAFFLIVVAAFIWTTSAGDAAKQQTARNIIIAAMVGIVIAILAQLIPAVVLGIVT